MTTTFDTDPTDLAQAVHDTDPTETVSSYDDPQTIAAAWASSTLGELDDEIGDAFATESVGAPGPAAARAKLLAALAAGIIGGATLGAVLFGYKAGPPTVVVPGFGVSTSEIPAAVAPPSDTPSQSPLLKQAGPPAQLPKPVVPASETTPAVDAIPNVAVNPGSPPVSGPPVIDVWIPALPTFIDNKPQQPAPPDPVPPDLQPPNIDVAQPADPDPEPESPNSDVSRFEPLNPFPQTTPSGGLKPIDRSNHRAQLNMPQQPKPTNLSPTNRATLAKP